MRVMLRPFGLSSKVVPTLTLTLTLLTLTLAVVPTLTLALAVRPVEQGVRLTLTLTLSKVVFDDPAGLPNAPLQRFASY